ncbi:MAG TPA: hypothetical protein GX515_02395 [Firmicutes bacterium]|nr:hypothetical protein [Bacillota bacterium]
MRPLSGAGARVAPRHGVQKPPRNRGIWLAVAAVALAVTAAAVLAGVKIAQQPSGRAPGQALPAEAGRSAVPEKWRELQEPLPQVVQTGKNEETIPFRARAAADPFAADRTIALQQAAEKVGPGPEAATPEAGPHGISRIAGAPSMTSAQDTAAEREAPLEDEASGASGAGAASAPPSPSEAGASEPVSAAQVADTPPAAPVPEETATRGADKPVPSEDGADAAGRGAQAVGPVQPPEAGAPEARGAAGLAETETARSPVPVAPNVSVEPTPATEGAGDKQDAGVPAVTVAQEPAAAAPAPAAAAHQGGGSAQRPQGASAATQTQRRPVEPPPMLVTGIITSGDSAAYAIVRTAKGSIIVRPGDEVEGALVKAVEQKSVTVVKEGEEFVLELGGGSGR